MSDDLDDEDDYTPAKGPQRLLCAKGRPVFEQGAPAHQAFFVESGRVEVTVKEDGHTVRLAEIGPGEIFGEMGVLENEMRMATVTAVESSTIAIISKKELEERISKLDDEIIRSLIHVLVRRLRQSSRSQVHYSRELAQFQDRMAGLMDSVRDGISPAKREKFSAEIMPLIEGMEKVLEKYKG